MKTLAILLLGLVSATGCARAKESRHASADSSKVDLEPAEQPCEGPTQPSVVRVVTGSIGYDAPLAFMGAHMLSWVVPLKVVAVESGSFQGTQLGIIVHSPSMFATDVWGFGSSPQEQAAGLELSWRPKYCMYEVTKVLQPEPIPPKPGEPFQLTAPHVDGIMIGE
jgi:hypothetical protein